MRYSWPKGRRSAAVLSFDFDAESGFLFREPEKAKEDLVRYMRKQRGVWFTTCAEVAQWHEKNRQ
jgi:hypothetical protein